MLITGYLIPIAAQCHFSKRDFSMDVGFLLTFLVIFHLVPLLSTQELDESLKLVTCPKDFQCGKLGIMKFPFTNYTQPTLCGLCMVDCQAYPSPNIQLDLWSERLFSVTNRSQTNLRLHDPTLKQLLNDHSCYSFTRNVSTPPSPSISFEITSHITLFRCEKNPQPSQNIIDHFFGYRKNESCPGFDIYYKILKSQSSHRDWESPPTGCTVVHLPIHSWHNVTDNTDLFQLLTADFDLEWHVSDKCHHCHLKGGFCQTVDGHKFHCAYADAKKNLDQSGKNISKIIFVTAASAGSIALLVILVFCFTKFSISNSIEFWKWETKKNRDLETFLKNYGSLAPKRYHYSDLKKMTNSFEIRLGQGGYGYVYKGKLQDGSLVAVKVLKELKGKGEEFINEVASISRTSHVNIVSLLGFCFEGRKKALIYEFMPNGSLEKFIYEEKSLVNRQLEWSTLYKIAVGIARGLEYLHRGCSTRILHFDIKPHNVLLDEDFCPKISDFGLDKLCTRKESIISTMVARGTIGYIAPEVVCKNIGGVSHKSDVYSYRMMVLEMVGGRKNVDHRVDHTSEIYFSHCIYTRLNQGEELGLSGIMDEEESKRARKMLIASLWCIQTNPSYRPAITTVLEMLEGPLEALQMPPKPFLYSPSPSPSRASSEGYT